MSDGAAGILVLVFDFHHGVEEVDHQDLGAEGQDHYGGEALEDEEEQDHQLRDCSYGSQALGDCLALIAGKGQKQDFSFIMVPLYHEQFIAKSRKMEHVL